MKSKLLECKLGELIPLREGCTVSQIGKIQSAKEIDSNVSFMQTNFDYLERDLQKIREIFEGEVVVDLGAGDNSLGYKLACLTNAKGYVGVEPYHSRILSSALSSEKSNEFWKAEFIPYCVVDSDMLSFLRCVEDNSISILAAGIDDYIIHDGNYESKVKKEIKRTLSPKGGFLSVKSELYFPPEEKRIMIKGETKDYIGSTIAILKK